MSLTSTSTVSRTDARGISLSLAKSRFMLFQRSQMVKKEIEKGAAARSSQIKPLFRLGSTRRKVRLGTRSFPSVHESLLV